MMFFKMAEEHTTLIEEKLTQLLRTIFQEEFKKQEVHRTNIISSNFKVTMEKNQEIARAWMDHEGNQSNGTRNLKNVNLVPKGVQRILSSHKLSPKYNEQ